MVIKHSSVVHLNFRVIFVEILSAIQVLIPVGKFIVSVFSLKR
jgi:hypothetical protein